MNINLEEVNFIIYNIKIYFISIFTYYLAIKIIGLNEKRNIIIFGILNLFNILITAFIYYITNKTISIFYLALTISIFFSKFTKNNIGYSIVIIILSLTINYVSWFIATSIAFIPIVAFKIQSDFASLLMISILYIGIIYSITRIKRVKNGITFIKIKENHEYFDIFILNICLNILIFIILISNYNEEFSRSIILGLIISSIIMFITIQKSLQLYYKQKLQQKELEETKEELEKAKQEISELEKENLNFSKKSHSIAHKQKALEYKLNQLLLNNEIAEELDIKDKIKEISKQIQNEDTTIELTKTNIEEIDDMLKYMQSECEKNKIDLELQVNGNIHHMINKFIAKENLEILLADHIKNAIIAINYSENINRSILVKLGLIDGFYSIYIYDTGIEFEIKTLQNLGQVPSTTHADNGGTGMGFMNTFDTLNKYKASIIINEYGKPSKDNYTKYIAIKFDNKNEYKINSYRSKEIEQQGFLGPSLNPGIENV